MIILNAVLAIVCSYRMLMTFQQSGYKRLGILDYNNSYFVFGLISMVISIIAFSLDLFLRNTLIFYTAGAIVLFIMVLCVYQTFRVKYKKPLVFTKRVFRLIAVFSLLCAAYQLLYFTEFRCFVWSIYLFTPFFILLSKIILSPLEKINNNRYIRNAKNKLIESKAIKIGITGSFGKTSVKNILKEILSRKYSVLMTPESYNTPLGIAITAQSLTGSIEIFIAEMGARHKGDIKELTDIVRPEIGIVTGVNNQHMETFRNIENTAKTKYELIEGLTGRKFAVVNADNKYTLDMCGMGTPLKTAGFNKEGDIVIDNLKTSVFGTTFDLLLDGEVLPLKTRLLGGHNAVNIALSAGVAIELGVSLSDIQAAVFDLKGVPHRLELIQGTRGITIIDDTYNSNPDGAAAALQVLEQFEGRKVIVTPGLIELGAKTAEENIKLGNIIRTICDRVILIRSKGIKYIKEGLKNYPVEKIIEYNSLKEATADFSKILKNNDILLLLNDLPDSLGG